MFFSYSAHCYSQQSSLLLYILSSSSSLLPSNCTPSSLVEEEDETSLASKITSIIEGEVVGLVYLSLDIVIVDFLERSSRGKTGELSADDEAVLRTSLHFDIYSNYFFTRYILCTIKRLNTIS